MNSRGGLPKPTIILISLNVGFYIILALLGGGFVSLNTRLLFLIGQSNVLVMRGWFWQVVTSLFVHANILHLMGNMLFLLIFGLRAEDFFNPKTYVFIYLVSGIAGNLLTLLMGPRVVSVGASGAIFGVFGATVLHAGSSYGRSVMSAVIYSLYLFLMNIGGEVNLLAHLGGLVTGLAIGYALYRGRRYV